MNDFTCPFCDHVFPVNRYYTYTDIGASFINSSQAHDKTYSLRVRFYKCPHCGIISSFVDYHGSQLPERTIPIYPISAAKQFPDYIPEQIRSDYEEACAIATLSPKASATLSRRCLQGMIRDFWDVSGKKNLYQEIDEIKTKVPPATWKAINSLRQLGNIGAHMESDINQIVDIDPGEADKIIRLIEYLLKEWYIQKHEADQLLNDITDINDEKQSQKQSD